MPIRENIQPLEDIFYNDTNKINKIISLCVNVTNNDCKIVRAGKGLNSYINTNLFDFFPLIFKNYQIKLFMTSILDDFGIKENDYGKTNFNTNIISSSKFSSKVGKAGSKGVNKNKKDYTEI